jgi:hypothetical protein
MSRFHNLLNRAYREIITEQEQPPIPEQPPVPDQAAPTPVPEIPDAQRPLSPEGLVFLVRLLPKALMIDTLEEREQSMLADIGEINENNAREVLKKIIPIIEKYAPSTDDLPKV